MRKILTTLFVLGAVLRSVPVQAATVTTTADSGPGSLREAVANANPGETIDFAVSGIISLTSGELVVDTDVTLAGPGAGNLIIQRSTDIGTPDFRIFNVVSGTARISGLTVSNGRQIVAGGIFIQDQGHLTLQHCVLSGNVAAAAGGGLLNQGELTITNCAILGNSIAGAAGEGFGGGFHNDGTMTVINSLIASNSVASGAENRFGGGIYNDGTLTLHGLLVQGNSVAAAADNGAGYGGGLNNNFGSVHVENCTFNGNAALGGAGSGGGLNNAFGTVYVLNSAVRDNVARGGARSGGGLGQGGGIANGTGTIALDRSTVSGNLATGGEGGSGGRGEGGGIANATGTVYLTNSTVSGNASIAGPGNGSARGGGVFTDSGPVVLASSTVASNAVPGGFPEDGGGLFTVEGLVELRNSIVAANTATFDLFNGPLGDLISVGFNVIGSTGRPFNLGPGDQTGVTAAALHLGPLQDNGGPTFTHALLCGSPALDAGDNPNTPATDQRGFARIVGGIIDIGAYEANTNVLPGIRCPVPITLDCAPASGLAATLSVTVTNFQGGPLVVVWSVNGTARQTNTVPAAAPPNTAQVDFTAVFAVGSHQVTVSATDPSGCSSICAAVLVTVNPNPPPPTITADGPLTFARGGSVTLTSSSATGNTWSTGATTPSILVTNSGSFTVTATDTNGCSATSAAVLVTVTNGPGPGGKLYPIALHQRNVTGINAGDVIADIYNGVQPGNFGWLTWAGSPSEPTLVRSLTPPGNSETYTNPHDANDHRVSVGDWVQGAPGVSNGSRVRAALNALKQIDITVPVWDQARGKGNNSLYRVAAFARVRLTSYQLPRENRITARFLGLVAEP